MGSLSCLGQEVKFFSKPEIKNIGDTTYYGLTSKLAYNYFTQKFDSSFVLLFEPVEYYQVAAINKNDGHGYFKIMYEGQVLNFFEIRENKIEGVGLNFNRTEKVICFSMFKNGKLDGITTFYDKKGQVSEILFYRKGKYKKHLYHRLAKSSKSLKEGNKKAEDPFKERVITR